MKDEEILLEQYRLVRSLMKDLINTIDREEVKFLKFELQNKINYICKLKERAIKNG